MFRSSVGAFRSADTEKEGAGSWQTVIEATALYRPGEDSSGHWFDSRGTVLPLKFKATGSQLTVFWGDEETEQGRTVYRLVSANRIEVEDTVKRPAGFESFATAVYSRSIPD